MPYMFYSALHKDIFPVLTVLFNGIADQTVQVPESFKLAYIATLPKVPDSFCTALYRPISLLNCDYKIMMRAWSHRLGPILHEIIGHHQRGFIPSRDGRENILNAQLIIDLIESTPDSKGALLLLDAAKAFDRVSHEALAYIFRQHN